MTPPGSGARAVLVRWCSAGVMRQIVDPALADLQTEYDEAQQRGDALRARAAWWAGHMAVCRALLWHTTLETVELFTEPSSNRRMFVRLAMATVVLVAGGTALFDWGLFTIATRSHPVPDARAFVVALATQSVPFAVPVAVAIVALWVGRREQVSRRRSVVLALAAGASLLSFVTVGWVAPRAARAFYLSSSAMPVDAPPALTFGDLRARVATESAEVRRSGRTASLSYDLRWALAAAPLALGVFALALTTRRHGRWLSVCGTLGACAYLIILPLTIWLGAMRAVPVPVAAWAPDALVLVAAALAAVALKGRPLVTDLHLSRQP